MDHTPSPVKSRIFIRKRYDVFFCCLYVFELFFLALLLSSAGGYVCTYVMIALTGVAQFCLASRRILPAFVIAIGIVGGIADY